MANETIVRDAINYAHDLVVRCNKIDLPHKMEAHNAIDRIEAANARLKAANAKMREALLIIAGGKEARGNYEEVAWHMAQLAAEALAAEGGGTANGREDSNENETTQEDN